MQKQQRKYRLPIRDFFFFLSGCEVPYFVVNEGEIHCDRMTKGLIDF